MPTPALSVRSLSKRYELYARPADRLLQMLWRGRRQFFTEFWALRDVSFELTPGQVLGVVGRNGSGKSTLLQLVAGTLEPTAGDVTTHGRVAALLELGSGFNPEFSGRENVFLNGAILGLPHAEVRELLPEILDFADIGDFVDRPVKTYSSGMALRLAFAVATAVAPRVLIVDEALAVGDEAFQRKCFARIEKIRDSGAAVLFVSHAPTQILELCDTALLLDGGRMLLLDEASRVVPEYQRLLYAPRPAGVRLPAPVDASSPPAGAAVEGDADARAGVDAAAESSGASFDPGLRSQSEVEYAQHGARISGCVLLTPDGEPVNVLVPGGAYAVAYDVEFQQPATRLRFGMMIKTTSGVELGGGTHPAGTGAGPAFAAGERVRLCFAFRCRLHPGMYFLNVGVMGEVDGVETFLHRRVDTLAFRVQPSPGRRTSGYVDLDVTVTQAAVA